MHTNKKAKTVALCLAGTLLFGTLCACSEKSSGGSDTGSVLTDTEETTAVETDVMSVLGSFKSVDYGGVNFDIWTSNVVNGSITLRQAPDDSMDGEYINDALYKRDSLLEDKYNININYTLVEPDAEFQLYNKASKVILAGDDAIDLIFGNMQVYAVSFVENQLILDMNNIPEINLSNEWWQQIAVRDLEVGGKMYFATGDITPRYVFSTFVVLFNKKLFDDYHLDYPYAAVDGGTWTMDTLMGLIKGTYKDVNADDKRGLDDFYGFTNEGWAYPFYNGFGETAMSIGSGEPVINCTAESAIDRITKVGELFSSDDIFYKNINTQYDFSDIFEADRALLCSQTATNLYLLTDMESDFGVLPLPKYDESQDKYYSFVNGYCATAIMIPKSVTDVSMVGTLTEAMAAASRYTSTPAAYEVTLLTKQTRDEKSVDMLRLSAESAVYDLGVYFDWGALNSTMNNVMLNDGKNAASKLQSVSSKAIETAQKTIDIFLGK
jgi:ABC-type sugar transport system, periplasmic component